MRQKKVIVLGGGVAGMSAAQELAERGFAVEVYELRPIPGGKARSLPAFEPGSAAHPAVAGRAFAGPGRRLLRPLLPGEHGFRFFPGFYRHIIDTMARIPHRGRTVADNLVDTTQVHIARFGKRPVYYPARFPQTPTEVMTAIHFVIGLLTAELDVPAHETAYFVEKMFQILTSCDQRRLDEYEQVGWYEFVDAGTRSAGYRDFFANGFTRSLVAAKAQRASTRTIGNIFIQMVLSAITPPKTADRLLNGPTSDVWISPWFEHLAQQGVAYHQDAQVVGLEFKHGRIRAARIARYGREFRVEGDYFIAALPVERLAEMVTAEMVSADPSLRHLSELSQQVEWMNGIMFYLTEDRPLVHGHSIFMDTPWALTSVSQPQFWPDYDISQYGDGKVRGILSVCISDWDVKGLNGKKADECTREEIKDEVWEELKRSVNVGGEEVLRDDMLHYWFLDPAILDTDPTVPGHETNAEPLLVNYVDTWKLRPEAVTAIPNFFLASDYVRTHTDIATMEAANEAARRAVNGVLRASGSVADPCGVWPLQEPEVFAPLREYDAKRLAAGQPWDTNLTAAAHQAILLADQVINLVSPPPPAPAGGGVRIVPPAVP
ncbi:MAG TPA: FAD-dependent oxidoreductase [Polyangia bacterium]|jgi:uncharacterized protein with NAD-binding domain and iron-sulfur cluster